MTQYLISIHRPENYDPFIAEDPAMGRNIDVLNDDMVAAGVRVFVGGLRPPSSARSLRTQPDGTVLVTEGLYLGSKEYVGGFWVLDVANLEEALTWGRKAAIACRAPVEVRPFH
ncbi:YciI family protein [Undibacterium sp. Ji22W]|uniref:YciI family protein n=1 Tax=Undibacterium sp. Ji22W TaxID=3413038 RepID=UPI003BF0AD32